MTELPTCVSDDSLYEQKQKEKRERNLTKDSIPLLTRFSERYVSSSIQWKLMPKARPSEVERNIQFAAHRHRIKMMTCNVDNKPPRYQAARQTGVVGLYNNAVTFMNRTKNNMQMLASLSNLMRTHGEIVPFRKEQPAVSSTLPFQIKILERVDEENRDIAKRILDVVAEIDTGRKKSKARQPLRKSHSHVTKRFTMNTMPLKKYRGYNIQMPQTNKECWLLLRPHIYLDLYLTDSRPLGRIVIELFTEAAPLVVLELVRSCKLKKHKHLVISRLFPDLWLDVELSMSSSSELRKPLEYDAKIIDHGAHSNVLSFRRDYLKGFRNSLCFSLSFKPLSVANGTRIGFGRVIKNSKIFDSLQVYGTKNGVLRRSLVISGCGVL